MARQDLSPNQAVSFLLDACCALRTLETLPDTEISPGGKVLVDLIKQAVCSCASVLDNVIEVEFEKEGDE